MLLHGAISIDVGALRRGMPWAQQVEPWINRPRIIVDHGIWTVVVAVAMPHPISMAQVATSVVDRIQWAAENVMRISLIIIRIMTYV